MPGWPAAPGGFTPAYARPTLELRDEQVEGIGVYQGAGARHGHDLPRAAGAVEVRGAGTARVYRIGQAHAHAQPSPQYAQLQQAVMRWTGKPISIFQGRYEGAVFSVGGGG